MQPRPAAIALTLLGVSTPASVHADPGEAASPSQGVGHEVSAYLETHAALFQRALLPGANGALVNTETLAPIHQYATLRALGLDAFGSEDSLDLEFSAWGSVLPGDTQDRRLDADVQKAFVRWQRDKVKVRVGRQHVAGGAARYSRFDGVELRADLGQNLDVQLYGGLSVLPRYSERPSYQYLGTVSESDLRDSEALPDPDRTDHWLLGGRFGLSTNRGFAGVSFHEQRQTGGLSRRSLGLDGRAEFSSSFSLAASALAELDARRLADARLWVESQPLESVDVSLEYRRSEPALLLSRQSVLSVFSTSGYHEAGGVATFRLSDFLALEGAAFGQIYADNSTGVRSEGAARFSLGPNKRTFLRVGYARVLSPDNGYHSLRCSLSKRFLPSLAGTLQMYAYLYDEAILQYRASTVYATTLSYHLLPRLSALWGGSVARTPYAKLDLQTQLRLSLELGGATRRASR